MQCIVLYEKWQMECCGIPFAIGDLVDWPVTVCSSNTHSFPVDVKIEYMYEAHNARDEEIYILTGTVCQIDVLCKEYKPIKR